MVVNPNSIHNLPSHFSGLFLASLFDELSTTMQAGVGSFYTNMLLCGFLWPVEGMPWFLRDLAMYLPCTAACQGKAIQI